MKHVIITTILLLGSSTVMAQATDTDVLLGAAAGAAVGSTIGQGDGKTIATVIGGLIGANMAKDAVAREQGYAPVRGSGWKRDRYFKDQRIRRECERSVPKEYIGYPDASKAWVQGCIERKHMLMLELQNQAYEDGLNGIR